MIFDFWQDHPPVDVLVAGYLGFKPKPRSKVDAEPQKTSYAEMMAMFPNGTINSAG